MLSTFFNLAHMTCHCVADKFSYARTRGTRATLAGTRSDLRQRLPFCASDLLVVLTIVGAGALLEDCAGALADGCAMLPYHSSWAIRAYSSREVALQLGRAQERQVLCQLRHLCLLSPSSQYYSRTCSSVAGAPQ